jgi:hypothetical protein
MRFSHETILDAQRFFHRVAKVLLNLTGRCHAKEFNQADRLGQDSGTSKIELPQEKDAGPFLASKTTQRFLRNRGDF